jgi:cell division protein FtsZ
MVKEGLINLDFADVRAVMREMGSAMMGTGEASGDKRALRSAEAAISNPLIDDVSMRGARGVLISITGGRDLTLYEVDEAATRIREEVDADANIIVGATFEESLDGIIRVSVVATGVEINAKSVRPSMLSHAPEPTEIFNPVQRVSMIQFPLATASAEAMSAAALETGAAKLAQPFKADNAPDTERAEMTDASVVCSPPIAAETEEIIRSAPTQSATRALRMPRIEDFPAPGQKEFRARHGVASGAEHAEQRQLTLFQRIAAAAWGRREDEQESRQTQRSRSLERRKQELARRSRG